MVDYKTDPVSGGALEQRFQSYREQGIWYAKAAQKASGGEVKEIAFSSSGREKHEVLKATIFSVKLKRIFQVENNSGVPRKKRVPERSFSPYSCAGLLNSKRV